MTSEEKAREYVIKLQETGFTCFSCFNCKWAQDEAEPLKGFRTGVPEWEFFDKVEDAYKTGYDQGQKDYCNLGLTVVSPSTYLEFSKQIEKLKCCANCKYNKRCIRPYGTKNCDKWELAE